MSDSEKRDTYIKKKGNHVEKELRKQIQEIQDSLNVCEKERTDYLDGWKRTKADVLNEKRRVIQQIEIQKNMVLVDCVRKILPIIDSARSALSAVSKNDTTDAWYRGVESIHTQCLQTLTGLGAKIIEPTGKTFNPHQHESVGEDIVTTKEKQNTITTIISIGAKIGTHIVRAAKVRVGVYKDK